MIKEITYMFSCVYEALLLCYLIMNQFFQLPYTLVLTKIGIVAGIYMFIVLIYERGANSTI